MYLYSSIWEHQGNIVSGDIYAHHGYQDPVDWEFWLTPEALEESARMSVNAPQKTDIGS